MVLKILSCLLYIAEVESLRIKATKSDIFTPETITNNCTDINWQKILYVDRFQSFSMIKLIQLTIAIYGLFETLFYLLLSFNVDF